MSMISIAFCLETSLGMFLMSKKQGILWVDSFECLHFLCKYVFLFRILCMVYEVHTSFNSDIVVIGHKLVGEMHGVHSNH